MTDAGASTATFEALRARLNLLAVLPNLEDVVRDDPEMRALVADERFTVKFVVARGPRAFVRFAGGGCTVGEGPPRKDDAPSVVLGFLSPSHLNKMFDGKAQPLPVWGLTHLRFLQGPLTELTERLTYYLTPSDELLAHPGYLRMNTQLTLNTAAFAVPLLVAADADCRALRHALGSGVIVLKVLPDGPAVSLDVSAAGIRPVKGELPGASATVLLPDLQVASDFLNGKLDTFTAVAGGLIQIWGQIAMVDALALVLDRIPKYLTPAESAAPRSEAAAAAGMG
jgi:hypothetical protein